MLQRTVKYQRLSGLSLCRSPFILLRENFIPNLPQMLPTKFWFIWLLGFSGEDILEIDQKKELPMVAMFVNRSRQNEQSLYSTFHRCSLPRLASFDQVVSEEKIFQKSINQKQELPVVAMFINGSGQNVQSLQRTFHRCFLPSFSSFGQEVSSEKIFVLKSTYQKQELPVVAMFVNGSGRNCNLYRGTSIDAPYQVLVHLTKRFSRRRFF